MVAGLTQKAETSPPGSGVGDPENRKTGFMTPAMSSKLALELEELDYAAPIPDIPRAKTRARTTGPTPVDTPEKRKNRVTRWFGK